MPTENRVILLRETPDPDGVDDTAFLGIHCRDMCLPYGDDDLKPTIYRKAPDAMDENSKVIVLQGSADYGSELAYIEPPYKADADVSFGRFIERDGVLMGQALSECYWCVPCFTTISEVLKPRKDLPVSFIAPATTLTALLDFDPAMGSCSCFNVGVTLEHLDGCDVVFDDGQCDDLPEDLHFLSAWSGSTEVTCECGDDPGAPYTRHVAVRICTMCRKVDDPNSKCHYEIWTLVEVTIDGPACWDDALSHECCAGDATRMIGPCFHWAGCFVISTQLMCHPSGEYTIYCYKPNVWDPPPADPIPCALTVTINE
jgi:hypothetical protein